MQTPQSPSDFLPGRDGTSRAQLCCGLIAVFALGFAATRAGAQTDAPAAAAPGVETSAAAPGEGGGEPPLEEVTAFGIRPLLRLRSEMFEAENLYFAAFNEINSHDDFDIKCDDRVTYTGTRIPQRVCRARFYRDLEAQAAQQFQRDGTGIPPQVWLASREALIRSRAAALDAEMRALLETHPGLRDALLAFGEAEERYRTERERRCSGRILFCRNGP